MARVLVIEDDEVTLETTALLLRSAGYVVRGAASGSAGLDEIRQRVYDVVLADLSLGDMTAIDLLDRMQEAGAVVPVIVMTGFGTIATAVEAMRRGAVDYAEKPLIGDDLIRKIEQGLAHAAASRRTSSEPHAHAATRWALAVAGVLDARVDVRTTGQWARADKWLQRCPGQSDPCATRFVTGRVTQGSLAPAVGVAARLRRARRVQGQARWRGVPRLRSGRPGRGGARRRAGRYANGAGV
jgi:FixJ family two-component response regulator